ncbi:hypothetical protein PAMA_004873 [Pampus argenteus]
MGSVTSALTRTRNALVKVGSEPESHDPERSQSAPESDRAKKKSARFVASQTGRQSSRQSLSEVLSRQDSDGAKQTSRKKTPEGPPSVFSIAVASSSNSLHVCLRGTYLSLADS